MLIKAALATFVLIGSSIALAPLNIHPENEAVAGEYIVTLSVPELMDVSSKAAYVDDHLQRVFGMTESSESESAPVKFKYSFGYAAALSDELLKDIRQMPEVADVVPNYIGKISAEQKLPASGSNWGLGRISRRQRGSFDKYVYPDHAGNGSTIYVLDTGCDINHSDFQTETGSRASFKSFVRGGTRDDHGHGTHVASTIAGNTYGVSKKSNVACYKVCNQNGQCALSAVIAAIEQSVKDHKQNGAKRGRVAIGNMSLGWSGRIRAMKAALESAARDGLLMVVASGNSNDNACDYTPAGFPEVLTVNALDKSDNRARFSNFGECTDVFAPGVDIMAARPGGGAQKMSGTSMASPHAAGVAALIAADGNEYTSASLKAMLLDVSTKDVVDSVRNSPNRLVFVESENNRFLIQNQQA